LFSQTIAKVIKITYSANLFTEKTLCSKFCSSFYPVLKAKLKRYVFHSMQDKILMVWAVVLIYVKK